MTHHPVKDRMFLKESMTFGLPIKKLGRRPPLTDLNRLTLMTGTIAPTMSSTKARHVKH